MIFIKALSVRQPFASAIALGEKTIEIRTWATRHRGDLLINSTKTDFKLNNEILPSSSALCIVNLTDCRKARPEDLELALCDEAREIIDNIDDYYAWVFGSILQFKPFKIKGQQRLYDYNLNPDLIEESCLLNCKE